MTRPKAGTRKGDRHPGRGGFQQNKQRTRPYKTSGHTCQGLAAPETLGFFGKEKTMTAFTIGLLAGGVIGIPLACWLAKKRKERYDGGKKQQV